MKEFKPIRESVILVVAWLLLLVSLGLAAKRPPAAVSDEHISPTAGTKASLIKEYDSAMSSAAGEEPYRQQLRNYRKKQVLYVAAVILFAGLTFKKGYEISEHIGRPGWWGGLVALLTGPFYYAFHIRPR